MSSTDVCRTQSLVFGLHTKESNRKFVSIMEDDLVVLFLVLAFFKFYPENPKIFLLWNASAFFYRC